MSNHDARVPVPATAHASQPAGPATATATVATPASPEPVAGLTVGHVDDPAEHAADRMADVALERLRRSAQPTGAVPTGAEPADAEVDQHAHSPGCGHLRRSVAPSVPSSAGSVPAGGSAVVGAAGGLLDPATTDRVEAARGGGSPLPGDVRRRMETGFGTGLGHVRVHAGPQAAQLSAAMGAQAFTTGSDIFFGGGGFAPDTPHGEQVLAHEIAHVISEPGGVRRWNPFKKRTPEEQAARDEKKRQEAERAAAVKQSKKTEKAELAGLKKKRKEGDAGRADLTAKLYDGTNDTELVVAGKVNDAGHVALGASGPQQRANDLNKSFEKALLREREVFDELKENKLGGSDEKRAELAYAQVWNTEFPELRPVAPPRETAAERLVIQVRNSRSEAAAGTRAEEADKATLKVKMLPKAVEEAYDRMVTHRNDLMAKDPTGSEALADDVAWKAVHATLPAKVLAGFPARDGALDVAAWEQAEKRVEARNAQKARDESSLEASLALLPETERIGPQAKPPSGAGDAATDTVKDVDKYVGLGGTAINGLGGAIAGQVGKKQDKALRDQQGIVKEKEFTTYLPGFVDQGVGEAVRSGKRADKQLATGQSQYTPQKLPQSDATKAQEGIGQVTGILSGLMSAVSSAFQMVSSTEKAWTSKDPYEGLTAAKAGASGLESLVGVAKNTANLAKLIDGGVSDGVKAVIPGLDIASSAIAMARGVADVAAAGMRQRETDLTMFEARAGSTDKVNVMVYPLMKVSQVYTKHLEKSCWALGVSIINFSTSVAQVASAGGYGIPAAIKAATAVIDNLHKIAHYIASKVLAAMAKRAEQESAVMHVEGGAEDELRRHPKMAVDGIILKAAAGDPTALLFLSSYRINGKKITKDYVAQIKPKPVKAFDPSAKKSDPKDLGGDSEQTSNDGLLLKIREAVLAGMDTKADPQSVFEDLKAKAAPVLGVLGGLGDAWAETGTLADQRNAQAKDGKLGDNTKADRGLGWRIKQMFSSENRGMLKEKTAALGAGEALPDGIVCVVGDLQLPDQASPPAITKFVDSLTHEAIEAELKRTPRRNTPAWTEFLREALKAKLKVPVGAP